MSPSSRREGSTRRRPKETDHLPPSTKNVRELGGDDRNRLRIRIWTRRGEVTRFTVQYELVVAGVVVPAVRIDTAHGYTHLDRMIRRGDQVVKDALAGGLPLKIALAMAMGDLMQNWEHYRAAFLEETP